MKYVGFIEKQYHYDTQYVERVMKGKELTFLRIERNGTRFKKNNKFINAGDDKLYNLYSSRTQQYRLALLPFDVLKSDTNFDLPGNALDFPSQNKKSCSIFALYLMKNINVWIYLLKVGNTKESYNK